MNHGADPPQALSPPRDSPLVPPTLAFHPVGFVYPDDLDVVWQRRLPEFACAANGVSMLMPHVEPYVAQSVRRVAEELSEPLRSEALAYVRQEGQHHAQHRRFNDLVLVRFPALARSEDWMRRVYRWLAERRTASFGVAFAAGFESVAYAAARWVADHDQLLSGADDEPARLFLWHLAEEVEHKSVAIDVFRAIDGRRSTYVMAMMLSAVLLAFFAVVNTTIMLISTRRFFDPLAHLRLLHWTVSFLFELLPAMALSMLSSHHPSKLADPILFELWLKEHRPPRQVEAQDAPLLA